MSSVVLEDSQYGIKSEFLDVQNYNKTFQLSKRRHEAYLTYCILIKKYYEDYQATMKYFSERIKISPNDHLVSIKQFKGFLADFSHILQKVSTFKSEFYEQLQQNQINPIIRPTDQMKLRVTNYFQPQKTFQEIYQNIAKNHTNLIAVYSQIKKQTKDPVIYFDQRYTKSKVQSIQNYLKKSQQLQTQGNSVLQTVYKNAIQFQNDLRSYRQRLISNKYKVHKKIYEMSKGTKQCLTQTLVSLHQITSQKYKQFNDLVKEQLKQSSLFQRLKTKSNQKQQNHDKLTDIIISATQEYNNLINELQIIVKILTDGFNNLSKNLKEHVQTGKQLAQELNKLYDNQSPSPITIEILDLFNLFSQKLGEIPNLLHIELSNIIKLRQTINRHSQITLSLMKAPNIKNFGSPSHSNIGSGKNIGQLNHLFDQLSFDYLNAIIEKIYKHMQSTVSYLKNYFNSKYHIKKKNHLDNSMQISYIEEEYQKPQKKPSPFQRWIWKDCRNVTKYKRLIRNQQQIKQIFKFIQPFLEFKIDNQKQIEQYTCSLSHKKSIIGVLKVLQKNLIFKSSNKSIQLNIPYDYIEEATIKVKIFQKQLHILTSMGDISFGQLKQLSKAQVIIQQQLTKNASNSKKTVKKLSVVVSSEELNFINARKASIQNQLQSIEGYDLDASVLLQNVTIDTVYDIIYSDKPFKFKGKEQVSFMSYVLKKTGGSNYTTTKYKPEGPKFYSLEQGKTFQNTPLYSERINQYSVPLPPIPFMPKTCQNTQNNKIYWISHEQFDYFIKSQSKGAPYAETFYINILHKICKKENNVEVKIYFKVVFIQDSMMKGTIKSKSTEQIKNKNIILMEQMKKIMNAMGGSNEQNTKNEVQNEQQLKQVNKSVDKSKVKNLQIKNKILIGILVAVILINIILRFF